MQVGQYIRLNVQFIAGFAIAFSKGWLLTLVLLAVTPVLVVVGAIMTFSMTRLAARGLESYAQAGSLAEQVKIRLKIRRQSSVSTLSVFKMRM